MSYFVISRYLRYVLFFVVVSNGTTGGPRGVDGETEFSVGGPPSAVTLANASCNSEQIYTESLQRL